jgi:adenosylcobinamide-GDP ribazoletransferase
MLAATVTTVTFAVILLGVDGLWAFITVYLAAWGIKAWFHRKLGGITGDIIGFASELAEVLCLLVILALSK